MYNEKNEFGMIIAPLSFGTIVAYTSIKSAFLIGLMSVLVVPPIVVIVSLIYAGKKLHSQKC